MIVGDFIGIKLVYDSFELVIDVVAVRQAVTAVEGGTVFIQNCALKIYYAFIRVNVTTLMRSTSWNFV